MGNVDLLLNKMLAEASGREKRILSKVSGCVLMSEFEEAAALLGDLIAAQG
jgi:hypothetical protein